MPSAVEAAKSRPQPFFQPKLRFQFDAGEYRIKTVETETELYEVLRLRYDCFINEAGLGDDPSGIDTDDLDTAADHVAVLDRSTGEPVATYRLFCSKFVNRFYSQNEFYLDKFLAAPGVKLELGRACVHRAHRDGSGIGLVWRGVTRYIREAGADYLFGCSSVPTTSAVAAMGILEHLKPKYYSDEFGIAPMPKYCHEWNPRLGVSQPAEDYAQMIPGLLKSYLMAGAKVHGLPALDRGFQCTDFLTILPMKDIHPRIRQRYFDPES